MGTLDASEEEIAELNAKLDLIKSQTYYYEGQSEDVIQFILDNSVVAMRFDSEYNLLKKTDVIKNKIAANAPVTSFNYDNWVPTQQSRLLQGLFPQDATLVAKYQTYTAYGDWNGAGMGLTNKLYFPFFNFTGATLTSIKGKVLTVAINNQSGLLNTDGTMKQATGRFTVHYLGVDGTYDDVLVLDPSDIVGGQFQITVPAVVTSVAIGYSVGTQTDVNLIKNDWVYSDVNLFGAWIVE